MSKAVITKVADLANDGLIEERNQAALDRVTTRYALAIPPHLRRSLAQSPASSLTKQFLPDVRELNAHPFDRIDPIGDGAHTPVTGVVHRYKARALLKIVHVCPVYCRFCFRREMLGPGERSTLSRAELNAALRYIRQTPALEEIIMTGGDPLIMSPRRVRELTDALSDAPHLKKLRWHTRVPIAAPERVTDALIKALTDTNKRVRVAVHTNHVDELNRDARRALDRLANAGITLLSQSVLLKGVNDTPSDLANLFRTLPEVGLDPYYLHQLDLAPGTHHFRVPIRTGQALLKTLTMTRPDLIQPKYILDIPGGFGKVPLTPAWIRLVERRQNGDVYRLRDPFDRCHIYCDPAPLS